MFINDKTWSSKKGDYVKTPDDLINFFKDIEDVCKKHNMSISHEDRQGAFKIEEYNESNLNWLANATDDR